MPQSQPTYPPLFQALMPQRSASRDLILVGVGTLFLWLMARLSLSLPFTPVPLTGQTLGVMLVGVTFGARLAFLTVISYLVLGLGGMPVFSAGEAGLDRVLGPTGGYLLSYPLAAALIGSLVERFGVDRRMLTLCLSLIPCNLVIFLSGAVWLGVWQQGVGRFEGAWSVLEAGVIPFIPGDLLKMGLIGLLLPLVWRRVAVVSTIPPSQDSP